jgi:hypothetical protein
MIYSPATKGSPGQLIGKAVAVAGEHDHGLPLFQLRLLCQ